MEENNKQCACGGNCGCPKPNFESERKENVNADEREVEVFEFSLNEDEINELIVKLVELKQMKTEIDFEVDDDNDLLIHYEDDEDDEEDTLEGTSESEGEE